MARVLSGTFVGLQSVISFTYFGVSYQYYLELLGPEGRRREEAKTTRVKDLLFAFYAVAANLATLFGPGLAVNYLMWAYNSYNWVVAQLSKFHSLI